MDSVITQPPSVAATSSVRAHSASDILMNRRWADVYRRRGYNPLPSRPDEKRPFVRWSPFVDEPFPAEQFDRFETGSMQLLCGRRWGLVVIDLDGPEGIAHWPKMGPCIPRTWVTHSGGEGRHLWFSVPTGGPPIPSGRLWGIWEPAARDGKGDWAKHRSVEILGDRKLVMVPPSIHPTTGRRYRFLAGHSPKDVARPAPLPRWVLDLPRLSAPRPEPRTIAMPERVRMAPVGSPGGRYQWREVLDAVGDKIALARSWGLSFASERPNASGWCPVHAIDREDRNPSASFHVESGRYWEAEGGSIGLFELGVRLGRYRDWRDAMADLGERFGVRRIGA
jgi:hypothetical protein